eukprot:ctg_780.g183
MQVIFRAAARARARFEALAASLVDIRAAGRFPSSTCPTGGRQSAAGNALSRGGVRLSPGGAHVHGAQVGAPERGAGVRLGCARGGRRCVSGAGAVGRWHAAARTDQTVVQGPEAGGAAGAGCGRGAGVPAQPRGHLPRPQVEQRVAGRGLDAGSGVRFRYCQTGGGRPGRPDDPRVRHVPVHVAGGYPGQVGLRRQGRRVQFRDPAERDVHRRGAVQSAAPAAGAGGGRGGEQRLATGHAGVRGAQIPRVARVDSQVLGTAGQRPSGHRGSMSRTACHSGQVLCRVRRGGERHWPHPHSVDRSNANSSRIRRGIGGRYGAGHAMAAIDSLKAPHWPVYLSGMNRDEDDAPIPADHVAADLHLVEGLTVVHAQSRAHHLREDEQVPAVRLDDRRLGEIVRHRRLRLADALHQADLALAEAAADASIPRYENLRKVRFRGAAEVEAVSMTEDRGRGARRRPTGRAPAGDGMPRRGEFRHVTLYNQYESNGDIPAKRRTCERAHARHRGIGGARPPPRNPPFRTLAPALVPACRTTR